MENWGTNKKGRHLDRIPYNVCVWRRRDHTLSFSIYFGKPPPTSSTSAPPSLCHPRRRPHPSRVVAPNGAASGMSSLVDQAALVLPLGLAYAMMVVAQVSGPQIVGMLHGAAAQAEASKPPEDVAPGTPLLECVVAPRAARAPPECPLVQLSWSHPCLTAPCWTSPCLTAAAAASLPTQTLGHASPFLARMCVALTDRACVVSAGCARATQTTTSTRSPTLCTRRV